MHDQGSTVSGDDLYSVLGVPRTSSQAEIRKAYRKIARDNHPDRRPDDAAAEARFKKASYASEVLLNTKKRKLYDEFGEVGLRDGFDPSMYRGRGGGGGFGGQQGFGGQGGFGGGGVNLEDLFRAAGQGGQRGSTGSVGGSSFGGGGAPDFMDAFFNSRGQRAPKQPQKRDLIADIDIGFLEALRGTEKEISLSARDAGRNRELKVRIPKGVRDGGKVRLRGQGADGGDLVLQVHVGSHAHFERDGDDLLLDVPVTVREAVVGAKVQVPTLEGEVALRVPAGVKSGTKLRLRGKGAVRGKHTGDLIVRVMIQLPTGNTGALDGGDGEDGEDGEDGKDGEELKKLAEALDELYDGDLRKDLEL